MKIIYNLWRIFEWNFNLLTVQYVWWMVVYIFLLGGIRSIRNGSIHTTLHTYTIYDSKRYNFWSYIIFPYLVISVLCGAWLYGLFLWVSYKSFVKKFQISSNILWAINKKSEKKKYSTEKKTTFRMVVPKST